MTSPSRNLARAAPTTIAEDAGVSICGIGATFSFQPRSRLQHSQHLPASDRSLDASHLGGTQIQRVDMPIAVSIPPLPPRWRAAKLCWSIFLEQWRTPHGAQESPKPCRTLCVDVPVERVEEILVAIVGPMSQPVGCGDFHQANMNADNVVGAPISAAQAVGLAAEGPISVDQTITCPNVVILGAVHNGGPDVVHVMKLGADVTTTLTAMQSGSVGQSVLVDNNISHKRVTAMTVGGSATPPDGRPFIRGG